MPDQTLDFETTDTFTVEPKGGKPKLTWARVLGAILSLLVIGAALNQARSVDLATMTGLVPATPVFWALACISYLAGPLSEWLIFRRLTPETSAAARAAMPAQKCLISSS